MPGPGHLFPWDDDDDDDLLQPEVAPWADDHLRLPHHAEPLDPAASAHLTFDVAPSSDDPWDLLRAAACAAHTRRVIEAYGWRATPRFGAPLPTWLDGLGLGALLNAPAHDAPPRLSIGPTPQHTLRLAATTAAPDLNTPEDAAARWGHEPLLLACAAAPTHQPLHLDADALEAAQDRLLHLYGALQRANDGIDQIGNLPDFGALLSPLHETLPEVAAARRAAPFDAPATLDGLDRVARALGDAARGRRKTLPRDIAWSLAAGRSALVQAGQLLGLLQQLPEVALPRLHQRRALRRGVEPARIDALVQRRLQARASRDFEAADALRAELDSLGVEVMDGPWGSRWGLFNAP